MASRRRRDSSGLRCTGVRLGPFWLPPAHLEIGRLDSRMAHCSIGSIENLRFRCTTSSSDAWRDCVLQVAGLEIRQCGERWSSPSSQSRLRPGAHFSSTTSITRGRLRRVLIPLTSRPADDPRVSGNCRPSKADFAGPRESNRAREDGDHDGSRPPTRLKPLREPRRPQARGTS